MTKTIIKSKELETTSSDLIQILLRELRAMISFSLSTGKAISPSIIINLKTIDELENLEQLSEEQLKKANLHHNSLSKLIFPALPQNILYLD